MHGEEREGDEEKDGEEEVMEGEGRGVHRGVGEAGEEGAKR